VGKDGALVAAGWGAVVSRVASLATLAGLAVTLVLVPRLGAAGAALALLIMAGGRGLGLAVELGRREPTPLLRHDLPAPVVVGLLAVLAAAVLTLGPLTQLVKAGVVAAVGSGLAVRSLWRGRQPWPAR